MFGNIRDQLARKNIPAGDYGMPAQPMPQAAQAVPGQAAGVFGPRKRNTGQRVAGYLADIFAGAAGHEGPYAAMLHEERQIATAESAHQRALADQYANWQREQEYTAAHPNPVNNDTINDFNWYKGLSEPDRAIYDQMHPVYRIGADGLPYPMARGQGAAPTAPVGKLTPIGGGPGGSPSGAGFQY